MLIYKIFRNCAVCTREIFRFFENIFEISKMLFCLVSGSLHAGTVRIFLKTVIMPCKTRFYCVLISISISIYIVGGMA